MALPSRAFTLIALLSLVLAGCVSGPAGSADAPAPLTRTITVALDEGNMERFAGADSPQEAFGAVADVRFDYTHDGPAVDPAGVTVSYTSAAGIPVQARLADFTDAASVNDGDLVRIEPGARGTPRADFLTSLTLTRDGAPLASRTGSPASTLTAAGYPLPLDFSTAGRTTWRMESSGGLDLHIADMEVTTQERDCTSPYSCRTVETQGRLDLLDVKMESQTRGLVHAETSLPIAGPRIGLGGELHATQTLVAGMRATAEGETMEAGIDGSFTADITAASLELQFDPTRALRSVTAQATVFADAQVTGTGEAAGAMGEIPHPLVDETFGPHVETVPPTGTVDLLLVQFLTRLWALDLAVGDEVRFSFEGERSPSLPAISASYVSQVLGTESRQVGGAARETFRVSDALQVRITLPGGSPREFAYDFTYWVDSASFLPVLIQGKVERTFTRDDVHGFMEGLQDLAAMGDAAFEVSLPADARFTFSVDSSLQMEGRAGDLRQAAVLSLGGTRIVPLFAAGLLFGAMSAMDA